MITDGSDSDTTTMCLCCHRKFDNYGDDRKYLCSQCNTAPPTTDGTCAYCGNPDPTLNDGAMINHPPHYTSDRHHEPIDVIEDWGLDYNLGNVLKYISRAGRKGPPLEDLQKAQWYLNRAIERMKGEENE